METLEFSMPLVLWGLTIVTAITVAGFLLWKPVRSLFRESKLGNAKLGFHRQREHLEARFVQIAGASGRPRGLSWRDVEFGDDVVYAWDKTTRRLHALVAITVSFEAVEGGGMEEVQAVGNLRAATAVFQHDGSTWRTDGRTVFNLNPAETIRHYRGSLEAVAEEAARQ